MGPWLAVGSVAVAVAVAVADTLLIRPYWVVLLLLVLMLLLLLVLLLLRIPFDSLLWIPSCIAVADITIVT